MCRHHLCKILSWAMPFLLVWIFLVKKLKCLLLSSFPLYYLWGFIENYLLFKKLFTIVFMEFQKEIEICHACLHCPFPDFFYILIAFHSTEIESQHIWNSLSLWVFKLHSSNIVLWTEILKKWSLQNIFPGTKVYFLVALRKPNLNL